MMRLAMRFSPMQAIGVVAGVLSLLAGVKQVVWPAIDRKFFGGPAVIMRDYYAQGGPRGTLQPLYVHFDKPRPCRLRDATVSITDSSGTLFVVQHDLQAVGRRTGKNIKLTFHWQVPQDIAYGLTKGGQVDLMYEDCTDGPPPDEPATFQMRPTMIPFPTPEIAE